MLSASSSSAADDGWKLREAQVDPARDALDVPPSGSTATIESTATPYSSHCKRR